MLCMGRGLMSHPKLLMMDEPSHGLSPILVMEIGRIIKEINAEGVAILLVEQNARLALALAEQVFVLQSGGVVFAGRSEELERNDQVRAAYLGVC